MMVEWFGIIGLLQLERDGGQRPGGFENILVYVWPCLAETSNSCAIRTHLDCTLSFTSVPPIVRSSIYSLPCKVI